MRRTGQHPIRIESEFDFPSPTRFGRNITEQSLQPPAIRDRLIQTPAHDGHTPVNRKLAEQRKDRQRLFHLPVTSMDPEHIAAAPVASKQNHAPSLSDLQNGEHVVAVQPELLSAQAFRSNLAFEASRQRLVRTSTTHDRHPLPRDQGMTVANQIKSRTQRIPPVKQPAKLGERLP